MGQFLKWLKRFSTITFNNCVFNTVVADGKSIRQITGKGSAVLPPMERPRTQVVLVGPPRRQRPSDSLLALPDPGAQAASPSSWGAVIGKINRQRG